MEPLPWLLWWQLPSGVLLTSLLDPCLDVCLERQHDGCRAQDLALGRWIPYGAVAWSLSERGPWRPLAELPEAWRAALEPPRKETQWPATKKPTMPSTPWRRS